MNRYLRIDDPTKPQAHGLRYVLIPTGEQRRAEDASFIYGGGFETEHLDLSFDNLLGGFLPYRYRPTGETETDDAGRIIEIWRRD